MARYLRQLGSGHIYHWTEILSRRKDMVEFDPILAEAKLEAMRNYVEDSKMSDEEAARHKELLDRARLVAKELTDLEDKMVKAEEAKKAADVIVRDEEKPVPSEQEAIEDAKSKRIAEDKHIAAINAMTEKAQVQEYVMREFGHDLDGRQSLQTMKGLAMDMRTERLFEADG